MTVKAKYLILCAFVACGCPSGAPRGADHAEIAATKAGLASHDTCTPWQSEGVCSRRRRISETKGLMGVHGDDNRQELYCIHKPPLRPDDEEERAALERSAAATGVFFSRGRIALVNEGNPRILANDGTRPFCGDEPFAKQPLADGCSASFLAPNAVLTSGHCRKHAEYMLVRGFHAPENGEDIQIEDSQLCTLTGRGRLFRSGYLWVAEVSCNSPQESFVELAEKPPVGGVKRVYAIGHPLGLPTKHSGIGRVVPPLPDDTRLKKLEKLDEDYFVALLDTNFGNSGSPVFDDRHRVVGVIEKTDRDFPDCKDISEGCYRWKQCNGQGPRCAGAVVIDTIEVNALRGPYDDQFFQEE